MYDILKKLVETPCILNKLYFDQVMQHLKKKWQTLLRIKTFLLCCLVTLSSTLKGASKDFLSGNPSTFLAVILIN